MTLLERIRRWFRPGPGEAAPAPRPGEPMHWRPFPDLEPGVACHAEGLRLVYTIEGQHATCPQCRQLYVLAAAHARVTNR